MSGLNPTGLGNTENFSNVKAESVNAEQSSLKNVSSEIISKNLKTDIDVNEYEFISILIKNLYSGNNENIIFRINNNTNKIYNNIFEYGSSVKNYWVVASNTSSENRYSGKIDIFSGDNINGNSPITISNHGNLKKVNNTKIKNGHTTNNVSMNSIQINTTGTENLSSTKFVVIGYKY